MREHPDSPSAIIAHARVLTSHAWTYRGSGWAKDLSNSQRNGFDTFLERAREVLDQHREVGSGDPEWYSLRIQIMNGQNIDKATIMTLAREALDHEPTYQAIDYVAANAFLPKWGGSAEQLQRFVALAVAKSAADEGYTGLRPNHVQYRSRGSQPGRRTRAGWRPVACFKGESPSHYIHVSR